MSSIFLLEDEADLNVSMVETLSSLEATIFTALSVESAELMLAENAPPDLILLDLTLPGRSGYSFLEMLRGGRLIPEFKIKLAFFNTRKEYDDSKRRHSEEMATKMMQVPVIVVTSSNLAQDILRGKQLGVFDYILKPANPERLLRKIADCMLRPKAFVASTKD